MGTSTQGTSCTSGTVTLPPRLCMRTCTQRPLKRGARTAPLITPSLPHCLLPGCRYDNNGDCVTVLDAGLTNSLEPCVQSQFGEFLLALCTADAEGTENHPRLPVHPSIRLLYTISRARTQKRARIRAHMRSYTHARTHTRSRPHFLPLLPVGACPLQEWSRGC